MKKMSLTNLSPLNINPKELTQKKGSTNNNNKTKRDNQYHPHNKPSPSLPGKNKMPKKSEILDTLLLLLPKNLEKVTIMTGDQEQEECNNILK